MTMTMTIQEANATELGSRRDDAPQASRQRESVSRGADVEVQFRSHFGAAGLVAVSPVSILSQIDPTVRFVGSAISVLKPFLYEGRLSRPGLRLCQPALRTQNLDALTRDGQALHFASAFVALGTLAPIQALDAMCDLGLRFLTHALEIDPARVALRLSSTDHDLATAAQGAHQRHVELERDACAPRVYRHVYGDATLAGRNLNFGIRHRQTGQLRDVGNLVIIERQGVPVAVELAYGTTTLLSRAWDTAHPLQCDPIAQAMAVTNEHEIKMADALTVVVKLLREGLRPVANSRGRLLRRYMQSLTHLRNKLGWSLHDLERVVATYEEVVDPHLRLDCGATASQQIASYLFAHEAARDAGLQPHEANARALAAIQKPVEKNVENPGRGEVLHDLVG